MLTKGDMAPDLTTAGGTLRDLLRTGPVVVYFYPADFTPVCTRQACMVRDLHRDLAARGVTVIGVSPQGEASHERFRAAHELPFHLVADADGSIAKAWGVRGIFGLPIPFGVRRVTFLVGRDGRIADVAKGELGLSGHERLLKAAASGVPGV